MKLPVLSGDDVIKALRKAGFEITRQRKSRIAAQENFGGDFLSGRA